MAPVVWINGFPAAAAAVFTEDSDKLELRSAAKELRRLDSTRQIYEPIASEIANEGRDIYS